jgi:hypothetical protein
MKIISLILLVSLLGSLWLYPSATPALGIASLLSSLAIAIHAIIEKHKGTEHARAKILKEVSVMVLTLILIILLGGLAAMLANSYVSLNFGTVVGLLSAVAVSFIIGYAVKKGMGRLS